jgi:hypothetical protein
MRTIAILVLLLSSAAAEPLPVPKQGNRQPPTGYVGSGDYFVPLSTKCQAIPKTGSTCPWGCLSSGNTASRRATARRGGAETDATISTAMMMTMTAVPMAKPVARSMVTASVLGSSSGKSHPCLGS